MRAVGLITEYNPFHNGHLHHLRESLGVANAEVGVAVMSGHFLQRGEAALVDKWCRTRMALAAGVDLVIELPLPWACSSAPDFARGAVQSLNGLGGIDALCFGSEAGELESLQRCADLLCEREKEVRCQSAELLRKGLNYPQARARLLESLMPGEGETLAQPNNILGIEYLKALRQAGSAIVPHTIRRLGAGYHDTAVGDAGIASATGIRRRLALEEPVDNLLPPGVMSLLAEGLESGRRLDSERHFILLLGQILRSPAQLPGMWLVENGIENRLLAVVEEARDMEELISGVKARQLTRTRIQRMLTAILLGIEKGVAAELLESGPRYLHLLGASEKGMEFLARGRKARSLPLVQNFSRVHAQLKRFYGAGSTEHRQARLQLDLELRATQIYTLLMKNWSGGARTRDFYEEIKKDQDAT